MKAGTPLKRKAAPRKLSVSHMVPDDSISIGGISTEASMDLSNLYNIGSESHVRVAVNDLVAYEFVDAKTHAWCWGLGTVAALPGPRLAQLMLWEGGSDKAMPPSMSPVSPAERAAAVARLAELQRHKVDATTTMEDIHSKLVTTKTRYNTGRAGFQEELEIAAETLRVARHAVRTVEEKDWREIRSYVQPPAIVELVISATLAALGVRATSWQDALRVIRSPSFVKNIAEYDPESMSPASRKKLRAYINNPNFTYQNAMNGSHALGALQRWVTAQAAASAAKTKAVNYEVEHKEEKKHIDTLEVQLAKVLRDIEELDGEEVELRTKLGDAPLNVSPHSQSKGNDKPPKTGSTRRESVYGGNCTWTFTDTTVIVLRSSILVNYERPNTTVMTLQPEQVAQLKKALVARAAYDEQEQQAAALMKKMEDELEKLRGDHADTERDLLAFKAAANDHANELAEKQWELDALKEAAAATGTCDAQKGMPSSPSKGQDNGSGPTDPTVEALKQQLADARKEVEDARCALEAAKADPSFSASPGSSASPSASPDGGVVSQDLRKAKAKGGGVASSNGKAKGASDAGCDDGEVPESVAGLSCSPSARNGAASEPGTAGREGTYGSTFYVDLENVVETLDREVRRLRLQARIAKSTTDKVESTIAENKRLQAIMAEGG